MQFRTPYIPENPGFFLSPDRPAVLLGSCFSDNIAAKMRDSLWDATNPFGTLYNPESIALALEALLFNPDPQKTIKASIFKDDKRIFHSFLLDSRFSGRSEEEVIKKGLTAAEEIKDKLGNAEALFVTFGTSICYYLLNESEEMDPIGNIVSNCHKLPAKMFGKYRLSVEEIVNRWTKICELLKSRYPQLKIIFTVSP
ncbi:MAG: GSCFA domain-containing protein, partial [Muribaculaceae bacterium]|nr:GSCFA domain-containing protein [Muribaculaceae bacterium]